VVSSDQAVQAAARIAGAQVQTAENFSRLLKETLKGAVTPAEKGSERVITPDEVEYWLELFDTKRETNN
jgi:hypothetical protein